MLMHKGACNPSSIETITNCNWKRKRKHRMEKADHLYHRNGLISWAKSLWLVAVCLTRNDTVKRVDPDSHNYCALIHISMLVNLLSGLNSTF